MKRTKKSLNRLLSLVLVPALPLLCLAFPLLQQDSDGTAYTAPTAAVLYAEPDRGSKILSTLSPGAEVTALEAFDNGWQRIRTRDGLSGYLWRPEDEAAMQAAPTPRPVKAEPVPYTLTCAAALFRQADKSGDVLQHLNSGDRLELTGAVKNGMIMAKSSTGLLGFLDSTIIDGATAGDLINILGGSRAPEGVQNLFSAENMLLSFPDRLALLREYLPAGRYWNTLGFDAGGLSQEWAAGLTTERPCAHSENGFQYCQAYEGKFKRLFPDDSALQNVGFASMASDFLFGKDAPTRTHQDLAALQPGDCIRLTDTGQYLLITEIQERSYKVLLCNNDGENCKITWDREIPKKDLTLKKLTVISRIDG